MTEAGHLNHCFERDINAERQMPEDFNRSFLTPCNVRLLIKAFIIACLVAQFNSVSRLP